MRILLVQPSLEPPGGGNLVAAWMLQALRDEHALSLLTWTRPNVAAWNRHYGTSLRENDFALHLVPGLARALGRVSPIPFALLKDAYLMRRSHGLAPQHDLVMGCNNETDFGCRGIQYVNYPKFLMDRPAVDLRWYHASARLVALYYRVAARFARLSTARMRSNLTLVCSGHVAARLRTLYGTDALVLYPPVPGEFAEVPWADRENGFVCVGRLSREKRIDTIVEILRRVRDGGDEITLHVVGVPDDPPYVQTLRRLAAEHGAWVRLHLDLPREELVRLLARQRYGIHAMLDESFGIAVAEMVHAGSIVFAPVGAGPAEILGGEPALCWSSPDDAVAKIHAVLRDSERQAALHRRLAERASRFSTERFCAELRALVRDFTARPA